MSSRRGSKATQRNPVCKKKKKGKKSKAKEFKVALSRKEVRASLEYLSLFLKRRRNKEKVLSYVLLNSEPPGSLGKGWCRLKVSSLVQMAG